MNLKENLLRKLDKDFSQFNVESKTTLAQMVARYEPFNGSQHTFKRIMQLINYEDILDIFAEIRWGLILNSLGFDIEIEPFKNSSDHIKKPDMKLAIGDKTFTVEITRIRSTAKTNFWVNGLSDGTLQDLNDRGYYAEFPDNPALSGEKFRIVRAQHIHMDLKKFQIANGKIISKLNDKLNQLAGHKYTIVCIWDERDCVDSSIFGFMLQQDKHLWPIFKDLLNQTNCFCWLTNNSSAKERCMCIPSYQKRHEAGAECFELSKRLRDFANTKFNSLEMRAIPNEVEPKGLIKLDISKIRDPLST